jgi:hypothetical protein
MTNYKPPMLIDAFRLTGANEEITIQNLIGHYSSAGGGWNHLRSVAALKLAYSGVTDLEGLVKGCQGSEKDSELDNAKIVEAAAPHIIGRKTQCFPYKKHSYAVTPKIFCPMGPAFYIVEGGVIKLIYIHARNNSRASLHNLASFSFVVKRAILEQEFFGQPSDVEVHYVDKTGENRIDSVHTLETLRRYLREDPDETLSRFARAFMTVDEGKLAGDGARRRPAKKPVHDPSQASFSM